MKILVINSGSSSIKFQLIDSSGFKWLFKGIIELRFGGKSHFKASTQKKQIEMDVKVNDYYEGLNLAIEVLLAEKLVKNLKEIKIIGHRVVHGGEEYKKPTLITEKVIKKIEEFCKLAPLHNPPNLEGIRACQKIFPHVKQVAVFDTAFYSTMPEKAYLYALPYSLYKKEKIRRYGFHGTSHEYVVSQALKLLRNPHAKIVSCHMGNGVSITASINGKAIDTSMGFTPLEGVPMGTRCGDIDPFIPIHLQKKLGMSADEVDVILNHKSGFFGICGKSNMKDIWALAQKGTPSAKLAIEILAYRTAKYIGGYAAGMNGLNAIIFTAGMGENAWYLRRDICENLEFLGAKIDKNKNLKNKTLISSSSSKIKIFVIPTNEEVLIAKESFRVRPTF